MNSALLTDLYQLTMSYGYWKNQMSEREAVFHLFYRRAPFGGNACIAAGTVPALEYLSQLAFTGEELDYLSSLKGNDDRPLFEEGFITYLQEMEWRLDVHGMEEGEVVFPNEPIMRVQGPLVQCQIVETALLNLVNFQTLIATKAARVCEAAGEDAVLEFGLRRAQGPDGGLSASRAAYIGGCDATSNVLAGKEFGIPVKGTHAHSWVMSFEDEGEAFEAYAAALPNNVVLLVDTYNALDGVKNAIKVGKKLAKQGHQLLGVRLDSGDLTKLSIEARALLDAAGMHEAKIVASNDLDEYAIRELKKNGAKIDVWGIGTKLVTGYDQPALGGVYKLGAIRDLEGKWQPRVKLSNDLIKVSNPGVLQVSREKDCAGKIIKDTIFDEEIGLTQKEERAENLLVPMILKGKRCYESKPLEQVRACAKASWAVIDKEEAPPICLDEKVEQTKRELLIKNGFNP